MATQSIKNDQTPVKTCIITGGAGVLGSAIAVRLASEGIQTVLIGRNKAKLDVMADSVFKDTSCPSIGIAADVTDKAQLIAACEIILRKFGRIDYLVNAAGGNAPSATTEIEFMSDHNDFDKSFFNLQMDGFDQVTNLNMMGSLLPAMVFGAELVKQKFGSIVNISSMAAFGPLTRIPAYAVSKAAVNSFTQWLAVHLAKTGVRVNAVAPGFFLTDQNHFLLINEQDNQLTARGRKIIEHTPLGRFGDPADLAGVVSFLLNDASSFITGVIIPVDGGFSSYSGV